MFAGLIIFAIVVVFVAVATAVLVILRARRRGGKADSSAGEAAVASAGTSPSAGESARPTPTEPTRSEPTLVGFGPQTSSLPILTPDMLAAAQQTPGPAAKDDGAAGSDDTTDAGFGNRSFGFFGAVTSAISITPQVGRDGESRPPRRRD